MNAPANPLATRFRDLDAERAEARDQAAESQKGSRAVAWPEIASIVLCVIGFESRERALLNGLVALSERRAPRLKLLPSALAHLADVIMIDGADAEAVAWSSAQTWLDGRAVIWVNKHAEQPGHTTLRRPIQWPMLQLVLARTLRTAPVLGRQLVPRTVQPDAPMIMVLSGETSVRRALRLMLEGSGYRVTLMATAREGLAALHAADYACVLLAGTLPDLEGLEVCRRMRGLERRIGRVLVLMIDQEASPVERVRARIAGCDEILPRPQSRRELQRILQDRLQSSPSRPAQRSSSAAMA